jgi:cytochrome c1
MMRWLRDPPGVDPMTAMPNLGLTEPEARDIAAYLYTLD